MRSIADSVLRANPATKIIAMGDFNDDPTDKSIAQGLGAKFKLKDLKKGDMYNPYADMLKAGFGSLAYGDAWNIFDNIVMSENLAKGSTGKLQLQKAPGSKFMAISLSNDTWCKKRDNTRDIRCVHMWAIIFREVLSDHFPYISI